MFKVTHFLVISVLLTLINADYMELCLVNIFRPYYEECDSKPEQNVIDDTDTKSFCIYRHLEVLGGDFKLHGEWFLKHLEDFIERKYDEVFFKGLVTGCIDYADSLGLVMRPEEKVEQFYTCLLATNDEFARAVGCLPEPILASA